MKLPMVPRQLRRARAQAHLTFGPVVRQTLDGSPVLQTARVAGVQAARRAADLLPYTPDVELTEVDLSFEFSEEGLRIFGFSEGICRSGMGTRALMAVTVCAVTIVDMLPEHATAIAIGEAKLVEQRGGAESLRYSFEPPVRAAVLAVSDAVASGRKPDRAAQTIREAVTAHEHHGLVLAEQATVGDDAAAIERQITRWVDRGDDGAIDLILTVGGTGLAHTDVTVEAVSRLVDREVPGLMEAVRTFGQEHTPVAFMSRGVAGLVGDTLVVTLPGSRSGAAEAVPVVLPAALHVLKTLRASHEHLTAPDDPEQP